MWDLFRNVGNTSNPKHREMVCELFYWPLINFLTKALCGRNLSLMWKSIRVSRKAARTKPQQTEQNTIRPTTMEKVMNQMEQQNTELTFTQMPQPMHSSSEMKAIFDCEETSIQSLPAPHTHTHTHAVLLCNQSAIPMLKCSQKRFLQEPRGVEN